MELLDQTTKDKILKIRSLCRKDGPLVDEILDNCTISVSCTPEDDTDIDRDHAEQIRAQMQKNVWAWCMIEIDMYFEYYSSRQVLRSCIFDSEKEFRYEELPNALNRCLDNLIEEISAPV